MSKLLSPEALSELLQVGTRNFGPEEGSAGSRVLL